MIIESPALSMSTMFKNVSKGQKQQLLVLDNVNFEMKPGEIVALLGKSGSGKSTLLRIISGLIEPSAGEVYYRGARVLLCSKYLWYSSLFLLLCLG